MNSAFLILGSNRKNRLLNISRAFVFINDQIGEITNQSLLYETESWGFKSRKKFINIAIEVKTKLTPREILTKAKFFELKSGRKAVPYSYESRIIDIDIIFYNHMVIYEPDLIIPHPRMHERRFALHAMRDIVPDYTHPLLKKNIKQLLDECSDNCTVEYYDE